MYAVIMAGGTGTRLWPLSRQKKPKQFHSFIGNRSLVRETFERLLPKFKSKNIFVSTTTDYLEEIKKHLPEIPEGNFVIEPYPIGTAAACGLATKLIDKREENATIVFLPSDHTIKKTEQFLEILTFADDLSEKYPKHILTIGIEPTKPDTGLGYIQMDSQVESNDGLRAFSVKRFVEKPDSEKAKEYVSSGEYLWNAGIFIWKTKHIIDLLQKNMPGTDKILDEIVKNWESPEKDKITADICHDIENTSIDYGIMEKTKDILVIPSDFGWSDIGSWGTLLEVLSDHHSKDFIATGNHIGINDSNSLIMAGEKLIATVGLKDIVVIDTPDALLICNSKQSHAIKELLGKLKDQGKHLYL